MQRKNYINLEKTSLIRLKSNEIHQKILRNSSNNVTKKYSALAFSAFLADFDLKFSKRTVLFLQKISQRYAFEFLSKRYILNTKNMYVSKALCISLSLSLYIYIYRERERNIVRLCFSKFGKALFLCQSARYLYNL